MFRSILLNILFVTLYTCSVYCQQDIIKPTSLPTPTPAIASTSKTINETINGSSHNAIEANTAKEDNKGPLSTVSTPANIINQSSNASSTKAVNTNNDTSTAKVDNPTTQTIASTMSVPTTDKNKSGPTTSKPNTTTQSASKDDDKHEVLVKSRGFDGPSFIGGIILTVGLLAVGYIGFKYYKIHTERNYHTL